MHQPLGTNLQILIRSITQGFIRNQDGKLKQKVPLLHRVNEEIHLINNVTCVTCTLNCTLQLQLHICSHIDHLDSP